jgi:hypothetical protein
MTQLTTMEISSVQPTNPLGKTTGVWVASIRLRSADQY